MGSRIDISVIIPAYNAADFLERAVDSVRCQEILSWELILVENGSADQTWHLCESLSKEDTRIHALQSDKGVSRARNRGMMEAKGNWICFLDADGLSVSGCVRTLSEIIPCGETSEMPKTVTWFCLGITVGETGVPGACKVYRAGQECLGFRCQMLENPTKYMPVWGKLFSHSKIEQHHFFLMKNLELAEDADFTFRYMQCCSCIYVSEAQLYHYSDDTHICGSSLAAWKRSKVHKIYGVYGAVCVKKECREIQEAFRVL